MEFEGGNIVPDQRVTQKEVVEAKAEQERSMSALMDVIEQSVPTQGEYFRRFGNKNEIEDKRVLLLRYTQNTKIKRMVSGQSGVSEELPALEYTMVTPKGIKTYIVELGKALSYQKVESLERIWMGESSTSGGFITESNGRQSILLRSQAESIRLGVGTFDDVRNFTGTPVDFQNRIRASIDMTEKPHKEAFQGYKAQTRIAADALKMVKELPPR